MLDNLETYEQIALSFSPSVLVIGGIGLVIIGLCIWLGGLRWSRFIAGFAGAALSAYLAVRFTSGEMMAIGLMAVLGAGFATFFRKITLVLFATVFMGFLSLMFFASPLLARQGQWDWPTEASVNRSDQGLNVEQTVSVMGRQIDYICTKTGQALGDLKTISKGVCGVFAIIIAVVGCFMPRFISALGCSALGSSIIYIGMIFLLLYKTARPLSSIYNSGAFYSLIFLVMLAFGTLVQMALCPAKKKKHKTKEDGEGDQ